MAFPEPKMMEKIVEVTQLVPIAVEGCGADCAFPLSQMMEKIVEVTMKALVMMTT